jgi:hypothetical protein
MVTMRRDMANHQSAKRVLPSVLRSLAKPRKQGFTHALLNTIRHLEVQSKAGLYLGTAATFNVDLRRLGTVIERTTLGMLYDRVKARLPESYMCRTYVLGGIQEDPPEVLKIARYAFSGERRTWGDGTFTAWFQRLQGPPLCTLWGFAVYDRAMFLAITGPPREKLDTVSAHA